MKRWKGKILTFEAMDAKILADYINERSDYTIPKMETEIRIRFLMNRAVAQHKEKISSRIVMNRLIPLLIGLIAGYVLSLLDYI